MSLKQFRERLFGPRGPRFECHLRELREEAGLSPEELAEHCKVSVETITLIEQAKYEPSVVLAEHLARRMNTTVESLFTALSPTGAASADFEERIRMQLRRLGLWCFYGFFIVSLVGADILFHLKNEEDAGVAVFVVLCFLTIGFLVGTLWIPGYWRFMRRRNREGTSNRIFWLRVIGSPFLFASIMEVFNVNHDLTWQRRLLSFVYYAVFWGGWMYLLVYRKVKPKKSQT